MGRTRIELGINRGTLMLSSEEITKGVAAFQKDTPLSQENETPEFNDEATTIYMQFSSPTVSNGGYLGGERLPHPLGYNRSVCLYLDNDQNEDVGSQMSEMLRSIGVTGDIKVMGRPELQRLADEEDADAIAELAESYDWHLSGMLTPWLDWMVLVITPALHARRKMLCHCKTAAALPADLRQQLRWTAFFTVPGLGYEVKVGHTGMTAEQISENIEAVLERFLWWTKWFPRGREHFESIKLKTGLTDGVAIYVNPSEVVPEPSRLPFDPAHMKMKLEKRKAAASVDAQTAVEESNETPAALKGKTKKKKKNGEEASATKPPAAEKKEQNGGAASATKPPAAEKKEQNGGAASATKPPAVIKKEKVKPKKRKIESSASAC